MTERTELSRMELQALELLPWYVNGTLASEEHELVRRQLRASLTCRLEYERLRRVRDLMQQDDVEHAATDRAFERLMARIEASGAKPRGTAARSRWLPLAQAAALLAFGAGIAWWWWEKNAPEGPASFETLTANEATRTPRLRVVFADGVPEEARRAILDAHGLAPVGPPGADGVYAVTLTKEADARAVAVRLRADPRILLVTTPPAGEGP